MCRDIGGSATIRSRYDLLLGIARASTLLGVTVINDEHDFETPLLLPASLQELMGATIILGDGGVQGQRREQPPPCIASRRGTERYLC